MDVPHKLLRAMRKDADGKPICGAQANMLGVRPSIDIVPDSSGAVRSGQAGLSVTPGDPRNLPPHVRPARFGGKGRLPVFAVAVLGLAERLVYRADERHPDRHGFIEPAQPMSLAAYQEALCATRTRWEELA